MVLIVDWWILLMGLDDWKIKRRDDGAGCAPLRQREPNLPTLE